MKNTDQLWLDYTRYDVTSYDVIVALPRYDVISASITEQTTTKQNLFVKYIVNIIYNKYTVNDKKILQV